MINYCGLSTLAFGPFFFHPAFLLFLPLLYSAPWALCAAYRLGGFDRAAPWSVGTRVKGSN